MQTANRERERETERERERESLHLASPKHLGGRKAPGKRVAPYRVSLPNTSVVARTLKRWHGEGSKMPSARKHAKLLIYTTFAYSWMQHVLAQGDPI